MAQEFTHRLKGYMNGIIKALNGQADASTIFPNTTDNGQSKERVFGDIIKQHAPASCSVFQGGFLFNLDGGESNQVDLIVTDNSSLKFDMFIRNGEGKAFACIDGAIAAISVKSQLSKHDLFDALQNIASIPQSTPLGSHNADPHVAMDGMDDGLLKVIVALDGVKHETAKQHLNEFFTAHPSIPLNRRPNYIWVVGKYCWVKLRSPLVNDDGVLQQAGVFCLRTLESDIYCLCEILLTIEKLSRLHRHIFYDYTPIFAKLSPIARS